ncbi:Uncharacterised protein [uncultured archaeon]|nr:Uncharacterised protein [uncultured archaeon]
MNGAVYFRNNLSVGLNAYVSGGFYTTGSITSTVSTLRPAGASGVVYKIGAVNGTSTLTANYAAANLLASGDTWTEASSGNHPLIATAAILEPRVISGAATVGDTAALYVEDENASTTVSGGNWALWVDNGKSRFDGNVLIGSNLNAPVGILDVNAPQGNSGAGTRFVIGNDGNVGVNTTAPANNLNIVGDFNATAKGFFGGDLNITSGPNRGVSIAADMNRICLPSDCSGFKIDANADTLTIG